MRYARPATLAVLALLPLLSGCRTAGVDNLARRDTVAPRPAVDARAVIAEHNRTAERVESLQARPQLVVSNGKGGGTFADGNLALERPRNFSLAIRRTAYGEVADIGSNDEKFWFWLRGNQDKAVYYCNHEDVESSPLATALQPDWIIEALGLRVIPEEEIEDLTLKRGQSPDSLVLTHRASKAGGTTVVRMTVISESTHRIKEHRLYDAEGKTLLARAVVESYMKLNESDDPQEAIYIPQKLKLEWVVEKFAMDVTFNRETTQLNPQFTQAKRDALFVEEPRTGYQRRNLALMNPLRDPGTDTQIRETRPAPPAGVELGQPAPLGIDGASRTDRDPLALSPDLPASPSLKNRLVPPAMARAPEMQFAKSTSGSGWRAATSGAFERER